MSATIINTSPNISVLDMKAVVDLCEGKFFIDATPSVYIGAGASSILGFKIKITNPYDVIIKNFTGAYDIAAPGTAMYEMAIPLKHGKYQYGVYKFELQVTDADSTTHVVTKSQNVCAEPDAQETCEDSVKLVENCLAGRLTIFIAEPLVYQGVIAESKTESWTVIFPSGTLANLTSSHGNFAVQLFEGVYKVTGSMCATYNFGDNMYVRLGYTGNWEKNVKCALDYSCINPRLVALNKKRKEECNAVKQSEIASTLLEALWLLTSINIALSSGNEASEYITELEALLGCRCTCECDSISPIINNSPSSLIQINGCNVTKDPVGLTDIYTIDNYEYVVEVDPLQNIISVSAPALDTCIYTQTVYFNLQNAYAAIKTLASVDGAYWAAVINTTLANLDATCLGYDTGEWTALSFAQKVQALIDQACEGGNCNAEITSHSTTQSGTSVIVSFTSVGASYVDLYVDNIFIGRVLAAATSITVPDITDGLNHTYQLNPICLNGSLGIPETDTFGYLNCPSITPPVVSSNNVNDVPCPYDLTALVSPPPVGITTEWHTANNTSAISLVSDPENVSSGVYYAFAKDADGCYSTSTQVTVICATSSCTAPQTLLVTAGVGGFLVQFQSAAFPPPSNSYTVKRRLAADADVDGSYTTIGTPTWNASTNRWEITDASASNNVLYSYKAISNCASSTPSVQYQFANLTCPTLTFTAGLNEIDYEFTNVGGGVDKYEVRWYDVSGTTLLQTDTHIPSFASPVTGTFIYGIANTDYIVKVRVFIGSFYEDCPDQFAGTNPYTVRITSTMAGMTLTDVAGISGYTLSAPMTTGGQEDSTHSGFTAAIALTITGTLAINPSNISLYKNNILLECVEVTAAGVHTYASQTYLVTDEVKIGLNTGACPP